MYMYLRVGTTRKGLLHVHVRTRRATRFEFWTYSTDINTSSRVSQSGFANYHHHQIPIFIGEVPSATLLNLLLLYRVIHAPSNDFARSSLCVPNKEEPTNEAAAG